MQYYGEKKFPLLSYSFEDGFEKTPKAEDAWNIKNREKHELRSLEIPK